MSGFDYIRAADFSEGEDEELMFPFEDQDDTFSPRLHSGGSQIFHSIDGVAFERPANPLAAVLERRAALQGRKRGRGEDGDDEEPEPVDADLTEEKRAVPLPGSRKRKTFERPTVALVSAVRPTPKRLRSGAYDGYMTAPACLMGSLSLHRTKELPQVDIKMDTTMDTKGPIRSASINIPSAKFQPIQWPGDAAVAVARSSGRDRSQSCSSSSSSKSWASSLGTFCRRSLDVSSPVRVGLKDLVLNTGSQAGSYTGS